MTTRIPDAELEEMKEQLKSELLSSHASTRLIEDLQRVRAALRSIASATFGDDAPTLNALMDSGDKGVFWTEFAAIMQRRAKAALPPEETEESDDFIDPEEEAMQPAEPFELEPEQLTCEQCKKNGRNSHATRVMTLDDLEKPPEIPVCDEHSYMLIRSGWVEQKSPAAESEEPTS